MVQAEVRAAEAEAARLEREARDHKRAYRWHHTKAREKRRQLDEFLAACAARGIHITVNRTQPKGEHGANPNTQQTTVRYG